MRYDFDLVAIGGGAAGLSTSTISALLGAKTALIEPEKLGGECTWYGCVPSKTLLKAAKLAHQIRTAGRYGLSASTPSFDFAALMEHVHSVQRHIYDDADAPPNLEKLGVEVIPARAKFLDRHTVELSQNWRQRRITSRYYVIATGSEPDIPAIEGVGSVPFLTNKTIFSLSVLPKKLLVAGSGPIGVEMAQAFCRLGSEVVVIGSGDRILPRDDHELSSMLQQVLAAEGIEFVLNSGVKQAQSVRDRITVTLESGRQIDGDALLLSTGRRANFAALDLPAAGVLFTEKGVTIDKHCRTSARNIYACGDVTGKHQFTHMAEHMGKVAVGNAILHLPYSVDERGVTWCTFTDPELARVGASELELKNEKAGYETYRFPFSRIDRAITEGEPVGWIKVFVKKLTGRIYGATILGASAGEMIGEYALAIRNGVPAGKISDTIHPYPTYALGNRRAADQWYIRKQTPGLVRWIQRLFGYRGTLPNASDPKRII